MIKKENKFLMGLVVFMGAALILSSVVLTQGVAVVTAETGQVQSDLKTFKTITASGEGAVKVTPDVAYVSVGVLSEGKELVKVQADNSTKMNTVIKSLTDMGIKKEEIKTSGYNVNPNYDWNQATGKSTIVGYTVTNTVEVTINDIEKSGAILDKVVSSGSNNINSLRFGVKDETVLYNQALEIAVKDAQSKASAMGKGLGVTTISPLKITESSNRYTPIYNSNNSMKDSIMESTPISVGELDITASVVVEFTFK